MSRQNIPTQPKVQTVSYNSLLGVDYQSDSTEVSRRHSPEMVNMISDLGGNPVKRYGYRNLNANVFALFEMDGATYAVTKENWTSSAAHPALNVSLVEQNSNGTLSFTSIKDIYFTGIELVGEPKHIFVMNGFIYILLEREWVQLDISNLEDSYTSGLFKACIDRFNLYNMTELSSGSQEYLCTLILPDDRIVPTVYTLMKPNGTEMVPITAGTDITGATKGVNLLTPFRRIEYCVQADTVNVTAFNLPVPNGHSVSGTVKVEILTGDGAWETVGSSNYTMEQAIYGDALLPDSGGTFGADDYFEGMKPTVTFTSAPFTATASGITNAIGTASQKNVPTTEPNLRITYAPFNNQLSDVVKSGVRYMCGFYRKERTDVFKSDNVIIYDGRLFVSSGNRVYYSRAGELFVIDDNFYFEVDSTVTGFVKTPNGLGVICEGSHPLYIASGEYKDDYAMPVYTIKAANASPEEVVSVVKEAMNDEPLIITKGGVYGITTNYYSNKYAIQRSGKINRRLCAEPNLGSAVGLVFNNYLYVAVGTHMYVLDGRHKDSSRNGDNSYECYFFDGMPNITDMWASDGRMYFSDGTTIYTWNDDLDEKYHYFDNLEWDSTQNVWTGGTVVGAKWTSPLDGDNAPQYYKTLQKKGTVVTISPPMQTSCQITLIRDAHDGIYVGRFDGSIFSLSDAVLDAFTKKKVKKYKRLQFVVENNEAEPFGIVSIVKSFVLNNYAKR